MRGSLRLVPDLQAIPSRRDIFARSLTSTTTAGRPLQLRPTALGRPSSTLPIPPIRVRALSDTGSGTSQAHWRSAGTGCLGPSSRPPAWKGTEHWGLGQVRTRHDERLMRLDELLGDEVNGSLQREVEGLSQEGDASWNDTFTTMRIRHGAHGVWACLQALFLREQLGLLARAGSEDIRDEILESASLKGTRIVGLFEVARMLLASEDFQWPDLYVKIMHLLLDKNNFEAAVRWHLQLIPLFPPTSDVFGALVASFVTDSDPRMQSTLTSLYICNAQRGLYDYVLPALFASGQSRLAYSWRRTLICFGDLPSQSISRPYIRFLSAYYPNLEFREQELAVMSREAAGITSAGGGVANPDADQGAEAEDGAPKGLHSDAIVAKLFASTWTSVEFAINVAHRLGVRTIGPRSLQSLALRGQNAEDVASHLALLEEIGIEVSPQVYCRSLITFAKTGENELLWALLRCDIHPDEFEDPETRRALSVEAAMRGNEAMTRLLRGIESAIVSGPSSRRLNSLLRELLSRRGLAKPRALVGRMSALGINITQASASELLRRAFGNLSPHPFDRISEEARKDPLLDRAIDFLQCIARHDVAIPLRYWRVVLFSLGRSGRLSELEQLSFEVVRYYTPLHGGLVRVHSDDLPESLHRDGDGASSISDRDEKKYIPADLPFSHHNHPVRRIFDSRLQRSIVRWAFDQTLVQQPVIPALMMTTIMTSGGKSKGTSNDNDNVNERNKNRSIDHGNSSSIGLSDQTRNGISKTPLAAPMYAEYDIARGVRLLAHLRDQGVLIDKQVMQSAIVWRISVSHLPGRLRSRARDSNELSVRNLKKLLNEAWGQEIFASSQELRRTLEARKPKVWKLYQTLCARAYA